MRNFEFELSSRQSEAKPVYPTREAYEKARKEMNDRLADKLEENRKARILSIEEARNHIL